jgi:mono/diheme cytochrome c family protein
MRTDRLMIVALVASTLMAAASASGQQAQKPATTANSTPAVSAQPTANPYGITAADKARKNPVNFTTASVNKGKALYVSQCAMCHGGTGNGKGDLASSLKLTLPDMTKPATLKAYTDGELFKILSKGGGMMPGQSQRLSDTHLWDLVNFLRSLEGNVPLKAPQDAAEKVAKN